MCKTFIHWCLRITHQSSCARRATCRHHLKFYLGRAYKIQNSQNKQSGGQKFLRMNKENQHAAI
jgi:hypothetical protein